MRFRYAFSRNKATNRIQNRHTKMAKLQISMLS